ncbi:MAG: YHS domain-containing protein [Rhizobiaceae bacterium]|nr:YHS domain-containing protein [Rhizobiaceae bacterium]
MIDRRQLIFSALATIPLGAILATTGVASAKKNNFTNPSTGVAINGYDPVAYFTMSKPVEGSSDFSSQWNDAIWYFSSAQNKTMFDASPEKYAPQYGGYCAFAVSYGSTASTVPEAWTIVDGKLYLNYSLSVRTQWQSDIPGNIKKANENWPGVLQ